MNDLRTYHLLVTLPHTHREHAELILARLEDDLQRLFNSEAAVEHLTRETMPPGNLPTMADIYPHTAMDEEDARIIRKFNDDEG